MIQHKVIVGLEIHVQLCTRSKMFCGCAVEFGAQANSRVCPVCLGMPGVLPVMNKKAFEYSVLAGLALNCEIPSFTKWDRKSYYYPDLPKNYQISQYDLPLAKNGFIEIPVVVGARGDTARMAVPRDEDTAKPHEPLAGMAVPRDAVGTKRIGIIRAHLEEDAGKNVHTAGNYSQVDLNRTGTPLLEIVTEPDMSSGAEARALAVELQRIVRYLGVSEGDMQKGHMRFEPNINLAITRDGKEYRTPIVEVKNLNSFRALERSIDYEVGRQLDEFLETGRVMEMGSKTTRGWDDEREVTVLQREKEEAHDYRYFPEPDLVPVELSDAWLDEIRGRLCELPLARQMRYVSEYGLSEYDAGVLTGERGMAEFFDQAVQEAQGLFEKAAISGKSPAKLISNFVTQFGLKRANELGSSIERLGVTIAQIADLALRVGEGLVNPSAAPAIFDEMLNTDDDAKTIAERKNLIQKSDAGELEAIVDEVLAANPQAVEDVRGGGKKSGKARGFLLGQVMQKTKGQANPKVVSEILDKKLC